jgi:hypothetical protein
VVLDLAVQAAGLIGPIGVPMMPPAPGALPEGAGPAADLAPDLATGCAAWVEVVEGEVRMAALHPAGETAVVALPAALAQAGEVAAGGGGARQQFSQPRLVAAAEAIATAVRAATAGAVGRPRQRREILVLAGGLDERPVRLLLAWAVVAGAAVVLEPDPARWRATVLWARPTILHGGAAELAALGQHLDRLNRPGRLSRALARLPGRRRQAASGSSEPGREAPPAPPPRGRLPLGRLHTIFQACEPEPADAASWQRRGARLLRLPDPDEEDASRGTEGGAGREGAGHGRPLSAG